jgi:hypothetical protein
MIQDEIIKMAWDCGAYTHRLTMWGFSLEDLERFAKLVAAKAIAELESQEPVGWIDSKGNMLCVKINESCRPLYIHPPQHTEQELVKYEHKAYTMPPQPEQKTSADDFFKMIADSNPKPFSPTKRTWVGLTDEETERLIHNFGSDPHTLLDEVDARLKARNT